MVITLCGSARFEKLWHQVCRALTLDGHVCFELSVYPSYMGGNKDWYTPDQKKLLDLVHLQKIHHSNAIVVINVGGYIGESTAREISYARRNSKSIFYLEGTPSCFDIPSAVEQLCLSE